MKIAVFYLLFLAFLSVKSQTTFSEDFYLTEKMDQPVSVCAGDIDGDGDNDVVVSAENGQETFWYKNIDGNGTFSMMDDVSNNRMDNYMSKLADFDNDDDLDLFVNENDYIGYYENTDGKGNYKRTANYNTGSQVQDFLAADFDGDGDIELVVAKPWSIWIKMNNDGSGPFGSQQLIEDMEEYIETVRGLTACDFDGDGDNDLIANINYQDLVLFRNNGSGAFSPSETIVDSVDNLLNISSDDFDGDGDIDLIAGSFEGIRIFKNDGAGNITQTFFAVDGENIYHTLFIRDFNEDGLKDILFLSNHGKLFCKTNLGGGYYNIHQCLIDEENLSGFLPSDIDGDSYDDIVCLYSARDSVNWLKNIVGSINLGPANLMSYYPPEPSLFDSYDYDCDGDDDVIYFSNDDVNRIIWHENLDGKGEFGPAQWAFYPLDSLFAVIFSDIDGDGKKDFVLNENNKTYWIKSLNGCSETGVPVLIREGAENDVKEIDFDNDGDNDILTIEYISYHVIEVTAYENSDGQGTFIQRGAFSHDIKVLVTGDITGDGLDDLIMTNSLNQLSWVQNNGDGTFDDLQEIVPAYSFFRTQCYDLDQDGDKDLIADHYFIENLDGLGTFAEPAPFISNEFKCSLFYDFDKDGDDDLVIHDDIYPMYSSYYENVDGINTFEYTWDFSYCPYPFVTFTTGDFDNDNMEDLLYYFPYGRFRMAWNRNSTVSLTLNPSNSYVCPGNDAIFSVEASDYYNIQWQVDTGTGFYNILDDTVFTGSNSENLYVTDPVTLMSGYAFRCLVIKNDTLISDTAFLFIDPAAFAPDLDTLPVVTSDCGVEITDFPTASNCSGTETITASSSDPMIYYDEGTFTVTWLYNDGIGGSFFQYQTVIINDETPPVPDDPSLPYLITNCSIEIEDFPTATDNCEGTITGYSCEPMFYNEPGTYMINWVYYDSHGNSSSQTQMVTVQDTVSPVPVVSSLPASEAGCGDTITVYPIALDNCADTITATTTDELIFNEPGMYSVNWSFDDGNGNVVLLNQIINVIDTIQPVPLTDPLPDFNGDCNDTIDVPEAFDNCYGLCNGTTSSPLSFSESGIYSVLWFYTDGNGNYTSQTQTVIITDQTGPVIECIGDQTINLPPGDTLYEVSGTTWDMVTVYDSCTYITEIVNDFNMQPSLDAAIFPVGETVVNWTATDFEGNSSNCSFIVTINPGDGIITFDQVGISLYPNPTEGIINFEYGGLKIKNLQVSDIAGALLMEKADFSEKQLDLGGYSPGVYLITIKTQDKVAVGKITVR